VAAATTSLLLKNLPSGAAEAVEIVAS
jgi:hypothetical protein